MNQKVASVFWVLFLVATLGPLIVMTVFAFWKWEPQSSSVLVADILPAHFTANGYYMTSPNVFDITDKNRLDIEESHRKMREVVIEVANYAFAIYSISIFVVWQIMKDSKSERRLSLFVAKSVCALLATLAAVRLPSLVAHFTHRFASNISFSDYNSLPTLFTIHIALIFYYLLTSAAAMVKTVIIFDFTKVRTIKWCISNDVSFKITVSMSTFKLGVIFNQHV